MRLLRRNASNGPTMRPGVGYLELGAAEARSLRHACVGTEHVLLALLRRTDGGATRTLERLGVTATDVRAAIDRSLGDAAPAAIDGAALATIGIDLAEVRRRVEGSFGEGALDHAGTGRLSVAPRLKRALVQAVDEAGGATIQDEHILLGLLAVEDGFAASILAELGVTAIAVRQALGPIASR